MEHQINSEDQVSFPKQNKFQSLHYTGSGLKDHFCPLFLMLKNGMTLRYDIGQYRS